MISSSGVESLFLGEVFSAYQVSGAMLGLEKISKPVSVVRKETKARQIAEEKRIRADREREANRKRENAKLIEVIDDDDEDEEYLPLSKRMASKKNVTVSFSFMVLAKFYLIILLYSLQKFRLAESH